MYQQVFSDKRGFVQIKRLKIKQFLPTTSFNQAEILRFDRSLAKSSIR